MSQKRIFSFAPQLAKSLLEHFKNGSSRYFAIPLHCESNLTLGKRTNLRKHVLSHRDPSKNNCFGFRGRHEFGKEFSANDIRRDVTNFAKSGNGVKKAVNIRVVIASRNILAPSVEECSKCPGSGEIRFLHKQNLNFFAEEARHSVHDEVANRGWRIGGDFCRSKMKGGSKEEITPSLLEDPVIKKGERFIVLREGDQGVDEVSVEVLECKLFTVPNPRHEQKKRVGKLSSRHVS
ncbi:hypothetical protein L596_029846 [Steinernema carpocapsae]|uniref:Uncharacterized protein n=1 Tax=Steinernema carpocapsae TaxID=34508 RepID=A0A4V5ZX48_STECR|nr:hypothetical protein L596_029846 [Steinernema carpocapsae]